MDQQNKVMQRAPSISSCFPERFSSVSPRYEHEHDHDNEPEKQQHHHQWPMKRTALHALPQPPVPFKAPVDKHLIVDEKLQPHHAQPSSSSASPPHHNVPPSSSGSNGAAVPDKPDHQPVSIPLPPIPSIPRFGNKGKNIAMRTSLYTPLYNAAMKGHWESAEKFLRSHPGAINVRIRKEMDTVLHIAAGAKHTKFVEEVVKMMSPADLALRNKSNNTALCYAAASGVVKIAESMVNKNRDLPGMRGNKGMTPLYIAALFGHRNMVSYLFRVTDDEHLTEEDHVNLLHATINMDLFDLALTILRRKPELATLRDHDGRTALHILAQKPLAFASTSSLESWQRILYALICVKEEYKVGFPSGLVMSDISQTKKVSLYLLEKLWCAVELIGIKAVHEKKTMQLQVLQLVKLLCEQVSSLEDSNIEDLLMHPSQPLLIAAGFGIVELVTELVRSHPDLIWKVDEQSRNIFHVAVMYRREKIFGLIHDLGAHKDMITTYKDPDNNHNLLHLAGKLAPLDQLNRVSGAALQMQRELLWFKEVEKTVHPLSKQMRDKNGRTPRMLFTEEHRALVKEGEDWMKSTASSCMLVATLITTVMFAAIFTVPGGTDNNTGVPILLKSNAFVTFAISDAFALFSSVTSILMFLSILTSRYAEEDFLESLPKRLIIGLTTLFLSIASMLIAFSATLFIVLGCRLAWILVPIALASCIPITLFAFLHFPLLTDMLSSPYGTGIFARESTITLCS
ncbi:ankyrin repeat-containing protein NPR4-like isoform X2 [Syzygium oleosum]|uniref:ankyrin repeat-containing protein NPR4-like isoform X2 n=1 Tax=Syzygium oleosum TaxID=219896 RepID=UPI0024BBDDFB|nr:ankyrin repeat-containing protein NPR4-like isoform X2 [Syzygium oleosum]